MSGTYNANAIVQQLSDATAMDPLVKAQAWARYLEVSSRQHDAFSMFESEQARIPTMNVGKSGIFTRKRDLKAGGGDTVNFTVISAPAGPGAIGEQELTGRTSLSKFKTYKVTVDWHRDAVEFTRKQIQMMAGGADLEPTSAALLKQKMGIWKQNEMMLSLIKLGVGNTYRPNNRTSRDAIVADDTLSIDICSAAKARLNTIGGRPISHKLGDNGDHINGFMIFATEMAMLSVRNDSGYQNAITQGHDRGDGNANFTGRLVQWQGMSWFEHIVTDLDWDDYVGSPLQPKAIAAVEFNADYDVVNCILKGSATNTVNRYTQFFPGYDYKFYEDQAAAPDSNNYYLWAVNPDGSVCFMRYLGSNNNGNQINLASGKILTPDAGGGASTLGVATLGELTFGASASVNQTTRVITRAGAGCTVPAGFTYVDKVVAGAILLPANAKGVLIGNAFVFGANAACRAYGQIEMEAISEKRDYGFVKGMGYQMITGQAPVTRVDGVTNGYLNIECAVEHEGIRTPSVVTAYTP